jgi:endonuclease YncB( thermonuclease family)
MTDPSKTPPSGKGTSDVSKGKKYRAVTNVSFGKDRAPVVAGQVFQLDDADLAKELIKKGAITDKFNDAPSGDKTLDEINAGEPANAAMQRGNDADAAAGKK